MLSAILAGQYLWAVNTDVTLKKNRLGFMLHSLTVQKSRNYETNDKRYSVTVAQRISKTMQNKQRRCFLTKSGPDLM